MDAAKKVIYNTGVLYTQLIIGMVIGLFTTRIVLNALGETNYGIYMLVAGVVGMLGILNSNMSNTSMRYMAHSLGAGDNETLLKTFNTTLFLHFVIGIIVILIMELGGFLMFDYLLNIPDDKVFEAKVVFQFMVLTTFVTVISVPYDAVINAHENMTALSLVGILGNVLRLGAAIYLSYSESNLLILYGFLMLVIQVLLRVIKQLYSKYKYDECKIRFREYVDRKLMKSILLFTSWNLLGSIGALTVNQLRSVLINMFFGVNVNASEGIARTATATVNTVSVSLTRAINPVLIKSEGGGNRDRMLRITNISTKFSVFLFAIMAVPAIFEMPFLLNLWLDNVPVYAVVFARLTLIALLIEKLSFEITNAIRAVGTIKSLTISESIIRILSLGVAYLLFRAGYPNYSIYVVGIFSSIILFFERLYFGKKIASMNILVYLKFSVIPIVVTLAISTGISLIVYTIFESTSVYKSIVVISCFLLSYLLAFRYFGINKKEYNIIVDILKNLFPSSKI